MLNLDTHMVVALFNGDLTPNEFRCVANESLAISDIVLWELNMLIHKRRLQMDVNSLEFRAWLHDVTVFPISLEIALQSTQLDFTSDPADEIIAATSVVEKIPLLTRDGKIRNSRMVPLAA